MRVRYFTLVMVGMMAMLARPMAAQMVVKPNTVRQQLSQAAPGKSAAPVVPAAKGPAPASPAAQAAPKPGAAAAPAAGGPKRDPFDPLLNKTVGQVGTGPDRLPPGKAGLMIGTLRLDGLVRGPNGMLAVVSNPQQRVYFLREGDRIFDGQVLRITMEAVSFQQTGRDPFGNSLEHEVTRRLYPNPGEQR
jgi:hypothetical protein